MSDEAIRFTAQVAKVTTLADGGIRITLDLSETAIETATQMMQVRQAGAVLEVAAIPLKAKRERNRKKQEITGSTSATY